LRSDRERLKDIRESIVRIEMHAPKSIDELHSDVVLQGFVIHELQVIGEAVSRLRLSLKVQYDGSLESDRQHAQCNGARLSCCRLKHRVERRQCRCSDTESGR